MRVLKPDWIRHGDDGNAGSVAEPIYSLDLDRTGQRLATAALGRRVAEHACLSLLMRKIMDIVFSDSRISMSVQLLNTEHQIIRFEYGA